MMFFIQVLERFRLNLIGFSVVRSKDIHISSGGFSKSASNEMCGWVTSLFVVKRYEQIWIADLMCWS